MTMVLITAITLVVFCVLEILTVMVSLLRLAFRLRIRRLWWEDLWAAVAMIGMVIFAINVMLYFQTISESPKTIESLVSSYAFTTTVWSVRMSLLCSIARIISPSAWLSSVVRIIGALFIIVCAIMLAFKSWWCVGKVTIPGHGHTGCFMRESISIFEVAADVAGDTTLVVLSLKLLWRVKLPRRQRRMVLAIFSSSAIMSASSLPHCISQVMNMEFLDYVFISLEVILSLIVCNLLVVVTYLYRVCFRSLESGDSLEDDDFTTPVTAGPSNASASSSPSPFTTVDLDVSDPTTATGDVGSGTLSSPPAPAMV